MELATSVQSKADQVAAKFAAAVSEHAKSRAAAQRAEAANAMSSSEKAHLMELKRELEHKERSLFDQRLVLAQERRTAHDPSDHNCVAFSSAVPAQSVYMSQHQAGAAGEFNHRDQPSMAKEAWPEDTKRAGGLIGAPQPHARASAVVSRASEKMRRWNAELDRELAAASRQRDFIDQAQAFQAACGSA